MSIVVSTESEVIRCISSEQSSIKQPPFCSVVTVRYFPNNLAIATAAHGKFTRKDVKQIYKHIKDRGAHSLYAERSEGHRLPLGKKVKSGPFAGLWKVVL